MQPPLLLLHAGQRRPGSTALASISTGTGVGWTLHRHGSCNCDDGVQLAAVAVWLSNGALAELPRRQLQPSPIHLFFNWICEQNAYSGLGREGERTIVKGSAPGPPLLPRTALQLPNTLMEEKERTEKGNKANRKGKISVLVDCILL
ncbi:hypothetical protein BS78_01G435500 [Paspalum vaginatum]|nr:hypothetical protein BS78_01G435500 [Paspalum vaginatum]